MLSPHRKRECQWQIVFTNSVARDKAIEQFVHGLHAQRLDRRRHYFGSDAVRIDTAPSARFLSNDRQTM